MAPGFSFPPPPPPPPKSISQAPDYPSASRGGSGESRGRGRGGGSRGGRGGSQFTSTAQNTYPAGAYVNPHFQGPHANPRSDIHGQKRKREDGNWRGGPRPGRAHPMKTPHQPISRPPPPPEVPSFGAPLIFTAPLPTSGSSIAAPPSKAAEMDHLPAPFAPSSPSGSEAEFSEDEEAAFRTSAGESLKFEHEGEIISLSTAADIEAWTRSRRSNFPTSARGLEKDHARRQRADERRRIEDETTRAAGVVIRPRRGEDARPEAGSKPDDARDSPKQTKEASGPTLGLGGYSSSEEEGDEDGAPEVLTSRAPATEPASKPVPLLDPAVAAILRPPQMCKYFAQMGKCRMGSRCKFSHGNPGASGGRDGKGKEAGRKTLYQRLLEQEQAQENTLAIKAIKYLGELGFFRRGVE